MAAKKKEERMQLLQIISSLQHVAEEHDVALKVPKLFVVGSQSRGKSSLVEAMAGLNFNFCGNDIASRFPINFTMINDVHFKNPNWTLKEKDRKINNLTTVDISSRVSVRNLALQQTNTVSSEPMNLELRWNKCPNLSFMDLPGLRAFAVDKEAERLKIQIEEMVQDIICQYAKSSNVHFLVVEDAKEDMANYHGLSQISAMLSYARNNQNNKKKKEIIPDIPDIDDIDNYNDIEPVLDPIDTIEYETDNRFFLVLNKFDNFLNSGDTSTSDKVRKLEQVLSKFQDKNVPVFFTSLPNTAEKAKFTEGLDESIITPEEREIHLANAFSQSLIAHSTFDQDEMSKLLEEYKGPVGFTSLKDFIEKMMMKQYRIALPNIRSKLIIKQEQLLRASGIGDNEAQQFVKDKLSIICANFSKQIELFLSANADSKTNIKRITLQEEYDSLNLSKSDVKSFSYRTSPVWRNKKYNAELSRALGATYSIHGGAQIFRLLREFSICIANIKVSSFTGDKFASKVYELRNTMTAEIGGGTNDWGVIISKLLIDHCMGLLHSDIDFFALRLKSILLGWFDLAWDSATKPILSENIEIPPHIYDELYLKYESLLTHWSNKMVSRMRDFVEYSVGDFNIYTFKSKLAKNPVDRSTLFSPSLSYVFTQIMQQLDPGRSVKLSESALIESSICESIEHNSPGLISDTHSLQLGLEDDPSDPLVLEKLQTICAIQVKMGTERIKETFRFIFESIFKRPFIIKLNGSLVKWSSKLPDILLERLKEDNDMLNDINTHIAMISRVMG